MKGLGGKFDTSSRSNAWIFLHVSCEVEYQCAGMARIDIKRDLGLYVLKVRYKGRGIDVLVLQYFPMLASLRKRRGVDGQRRFVCL